MPTVDYVSLNAQAVQASIDLVARVTDDDLVRPTPCRAWTLYGLLAHMATQHYGFAAASRGDGDEAQWKLRSLGDDPVKAYIASAEHVLAAFAEDGVVDRMFPLPELNRQTTAIDNPRTKMDVHVLYGILVPPKCAVWLKHRMIAAYESSGPPAQNPTPSTPDSHR